MISWFPCVTRTSPPASLASLANDEIGGEMASSLSPRSKCPPLEPKPWCRRPSAQKHPCTWIIKRTHCLLEVAVYITDGDETAPVQIHLRHRCGGCTAARGGTAVLPGGGPASSRTPPVQPAALARSPRLPRGEHGEPCVGPGLSSLGTDRSCHKSHDRACTYGAWRMSPERGQNG